MAERGAEQGSISMAAIQGVKRAGRTGKAKTGELVRVMREVTQDAPGEEAPGEICLGEGACGHSGHERADQQAKLYTQVVGPKVLTEGTWD